jgi:hypothetical protein
VVLSFVTHEEAKQAAETLEKVGCDWPTGLLGADEVISLRQQYPFRGPRLLVLISPRGRLLAIGSQPDEIQAALANATSMPAPSQPAGQKPSD